MAGNTVLTDLDKLEANIDKLEAALEPILENLPQLAAQLPLLDRAKLFSLLNYAAGTLIFCERWRFSFKQNTHAGLTSHFTTSGCQARGQQSRA
jgi:hypothetical protein